MVTVCMHSCCARDTHDDESESSSSRLLFFGLDFSVLRSLSDDFLSDFDFFLLQGQRSLGEWTWAKSGCYAYGESKEGALFFPRLLAGTAVVIARLSAKLQRYDWRGAWSSCACTRAALVPAYGEESGPSGMLGAVK